MRILVISRTAWRKDNSFGNTYSNYFGHMKNSQVANVYMGDGVPDWDNKNVVSYYRISEKEIVRRFLHLNVGERVGEEVFPGDNTVEKKDTYDNTFSDIKKKRWNIFFIAREIIWKFGKVDYKGLIDFVREFRPDIIFVSFYYAAYVDRIALYIKKFFDIPMVLEAAVDIYSMKQVSFSPLFWINRLYIRHMIRKTVRRSEKLYVISEKMKKDYERMLSIPCSVLYKSPDKARKLYDYTAKEENESLKFLFTGNVSSGRWKSLAMLGKTLRDSGLGQLDIYTPTPLTDKMKKDLSSCVVHPPVSSDKVVVLQNEADVLVHAESFDVKDKLEVRYSISTKVMDYISVQRCIVAIGPRDVASVEFLAERKLAICVYDPDDIPSMVESIKRDRSVIFSTVLRIGEYCDSSDTVFEAGERLESDLLKTVNDHR